ncbi:adenylate/guanylate cyclase domain-containing protein [Acuticoccus sp. I52.16.1]|uniref:adenylate/guanylate cyclase domain-containing protein n=1 Tax=Acuticoccus sp. I52.16.1 TaxID=2928472 RepID=UPI001FD3DD45|nr:adenylate/guanylate cyclase domain-containing protein [Acuticoccus sp. I52.16.1]UOM33088.1 adenylate/guanylate cyclase domain-containing protein [Acuticoccus sp. I52.16.1]
MTRVTPHDRRRRAYGRFWSTLRWHNIVRLTRSAAASFRTSDVRLTDTELHRLRRAERRGFQLLILCRTFMFAVALAWYVVSTLASGLSPTPYGIGFLVALTLLGIAYYLSIDSPFDRPFARYLGSTLDVAAISALFVVVPVYQGLDLPQIYAFRNSDIILLLPLVALTTLTLSPWLVLWSGLSAVVCWMAAYVYVLLQMDRRVSWSDMPAVPTRAEYEGLILSPDFVARGNRMTEALVTLLVTAVLALAVARARRVFYAQVAAETEREQERAARAEVRSRLGRFVPAAIAERVLNDPASLEPRVRHAAALFMDITEFTAYAHTRDPGAVIAELNDFLARCADEVAAAGGVVISFTGDGLLATFNTPLDLDAPEAAAVEAGRALIACAAEAGFDNRVGIAAGPVASGSVGSVERQAFTVYGDTVNRAARLEELAKILGARLLVDETCAEIVPGLASCGTHPLRGVGDEVPVWRDSGIE